MSLPFNNDIKLFKDNTILVQYMKNENYRRIKEQSRFGTMTKGTPYADYAIRNQFIEDSTSFIEKKSGTSKFTCAFIFENNTYRHLV